MHVGIEPVATAGDILGRTRDVLRRKHYTFDTEGTYLGWIGRYLRYHGNRDPRSGRVQRHHLGESVIQKAVKRAAWEARLRKRVTPHVGWER